MQRGRFVVLEGIDGSGTTTQLRAVAAALRGRGHVVHETHEPSGRSIGQLLRERLATTAEPLAPDAMALLFAADRLDHIHGEIEPALAAGETVVCDRYVLSSWAYQGMSCDPDWVRAINRLAPWPDLTAIVEVPVDAALARIRARAPDGAREIYETEAQQRRVAEVYAAALRDALPRTVRIDGTAPVSEVTAAILAAYDGLGV